MEWKPIETAPRDQRIWAWGDNWHWRDSAVGYFHSDYNGYKVIVCRDGRCGPTFHVGDKNAPTHWHPLPPPPTSPE